MEFFAEIDRVNLGYCESLGLPSDTYTRPLSDAEANGTPLSFEETMRANKLRMRKFMARMERDIRIRNQPYRGYASDRFTRFANRERAILKGVAA